MFASKPRREWVEKCYRHWTPSAAKLYRVANTGIERDASGCQVTDHRGRSFIDCACSYGIFLVGHANPRVRHASLQQVQDLACIPSGLPSRASVELSRRLRERVPGQWGEVRYTMTGAEAIEQVLSYVLRRQVPRQRIVVMQHGYHGKTLATMNILGQQHGRNEHGLNRDVIDFIPYGDMAALDRAITDQTAAVFVEPILGGAYLRVPPKGYVRRIRERCDATGAIMVADEIQTAFGRCGKWFAVEYDDVVPDIMVLSKGLTGGYAAIAAVLYASHFDQGERAHIRPGTSRNGGQPFACATALAALDALVEDDLIERSAPAAERLGKGLQRLAASYPEIIEDAPAIGLMTGIRLRGAVFEALISTELMRRGVHAGHSMDERAVSPVLRFYPPLTITLAQVDQVLQALAEALAVVARLPRWKQRLLRPVIGNLYKLPFALLPKGAVDD